MRLTRTSLSDSVQDCGSKINKRCLVFLYVLYIINQIFSEINSFYTFVKAKKKRMYFITDYSYDEIKNYTHFNLFYLRKK